MVWKESWCDMGKKVLFIALLAICLCVSAVYAADDSDFLGTWTLKKMFFGEYGIEVNASDFGMDQSIEITKDKFITTNSDGETNEAPWVRKSDDTITVTVETGESMDLVLEDNMLIMSVEDENGHLTRMKFSKPGNTCNCEELQKQIEDLTARIEALEAKENN